MPLSSERLPNLPLTGPELKQYAVRLLAEELKNRSVPEVITSCMAELFHDAMGRDWLFTQGTSYPRAVIHIKVRLHRSGDAHEVFARLHDARFSIEPEFHLTNPMAPKHAVFVRSSPPPLVGLTGPSHVDCFTLTAKTDNPNAIRVHYHIPIVVTNKIEPKPGDLFPTLERETLEYHPSEVPAPEDPVVVEESEEFAKAWGILSSEDLAAAKRHIEVSPAVVHEKKKRKRRRDSKKVEGAA